MSIIDPQPIAEPPETAHTSLHFGYIDGLRGLTALYVMLFHANLIAFWDGRRASKALSLLTRWFNYGHFAVDLFIVISGFCLMLPVVKYGGTLRGGVRHFYKKRAHRILPPYYAALAFSLLLATTLLRQKTGTLWDGALPVTKTGVIAHLLLLHNIHHPMEINGVFWSIAVEFQIYLLFPIILFAYSRWGIARTVPVLLILSFLAAKTLQNTWLDGLTCHYVGLFVLGNLAATIATSTDSSWLRWRKMPWKAITLLLFAFVGGVCYRHNGIWISAHILLLDYGAGLWAATLLVTGALYIRNPAIRVLTWEPLVWIGAFSYSLYLIHLPLLQLIWLYALRPAHMNSACVYFSLSILGSSLIVCLSYLFHRAFERPFMPNRPKTERQTEIAALESPAP